MCWHGVECYNEYCKFIHLVEEKKEYSEEEQDKMLALLEKEVEIAEKLGTSISQQATTTEILEKQVELEITVKQIKAALIKMETIVM